jgi:hypothetical protein
MYRCVYMYLYITVKFGAEEGYLDLKTKEILINIIFMYSFIYIYVYPYLSIIKTYICILCICIYMYLYMTFEFGKVEGYIDSKTKEVLFNIFFLY